MRLFGAWQAEGSVLFNLGYRPIASTLRAAIASFRPESKEKLSKRMRTACGLLILLAVMRWRPVFLLTPWAGDEWPGRQGNS